MYTKENLLKTPFFKSLLEYEPVENILDTLTKVLSRKYFFDYVEYLIKGNIPFSLSIIDLDDFKAVNDNYGHVKGDLLLASLGQTLIEYVGDNGFVGRFGGDEFLVVNLKYYKYDDVHDFYATLYKCKAVLRREYKLDDLALFVTGTIGCASFPFDATNSKALLTLMDKTLYRGKSKGRNCYIIYVEKLHKDIDISKLAKKSLYLVFSNISNILENNTIIEKKLYDVINIVVKELNISGGLFMSANGNIISNIKYECSMLDNCDLSKVLKSDGLYYCNNHVQVGKDSKELHEFVIENKVLSILLTKISYNDNLLGYLIFTEQRIQRLWQDNDFALLLFIAKIIGQCRDSVYLLNHESFVFESDKALDSRLFDGISMSSSNRYYFITNMETNNSHWSKNAVNDFNLPSEYINNVSSIWYSKIHPDYIEQYRNLMKDIRDGKTSRFNFDYRILNARNEYEFVTENAFLMKGNPGEAELFIGTIENHSNIDYIDPVTNLYNIYFFNDTVQKRLDSGEEISILGIALAHFSQINSIYGYSFGNKVLKTAGNLMYQTVKGIATLYKLDGVRFAIVFSKDKKELISTVYNKIKKSLSEDIIIEDFPFSVDCNGGAILDCKSINVQELFSSLVYSLIKSKYENNDELVYFNNELSGDNEKNLKIIKEIRLSVANNCEGFYLDYQPIVGARDEKIIGAEALLRYKSNDLGIVPPGVFIPWLENDSCFYELGLWIIRKALIDNLAVLKDYPDFILNVNIAYTQLSHPSFSSDVIEIINSVGYPTSNLCLEITERCRHLDKNFLKEEIYKFKKIGIKIAIDDFGTGYSSLEVLNYIQSDIVKIDRSFIIDLENNYVNQSIIESITDCSNKLGFKVCVEGVEKKDLIEYLNKYKPYSYQGYFYYKPLKINDYYKELKKNHEGRNS